MMQTAKDIIGDYETLVRSIDQVLHRIGIDSRELSMMDHVCYRVETYERYKEMLVECSKIGTLLGESEVNGRPIATFELNEYLQVEPWVVPYLELPAPKDGSSYPEGLEHAELVVVGSLDQFLKRHQDLPFSYNGINKVINPEAGLKIDGVSVKFHEQQLGAVVRIENQLKLKKLQ